MLKALKESKKKQVAAIVMGLLIIVVGFLLISNLSRKATFKIVNESSKELKSATLEIGPDIRVVPVIPSRSEGIITCSYDTAIGEDVRLVYKDPEGTIHDEFILKGEEIQWYREIRIVMTNAVHGDVFEVNVQKTK